MIGIKLCLSPRLEQQDTFVIWKTIYDIAKKKNKIIEATIGEYDFEYALINSKDGYGREKISTKGNKYYYTGSRLTDFIKEKEKEHSVGFGENNLTFVVEKNVPREDFQNYVGLHEYVEKICNKGEFRCENRHAYASNIELDEVFKRDKEFVQAYSNWLLETKLSGYFERTLPNFLDKAKESKLSPLEIVSDFRKATKLIYFFD